MPAHALRQLAAAHAHVAPRDAGLPRRTLRSTAERIAVGTFRAILLEARTGASRRAICLRAARIPGNVQDARRNDMRAHASALYGPQRWNAAEHAVRAVRSVPTARRLRSMLPLARALRCS
jgi:hypothetical protein